MPYIITTTDPQHACLSTPERCEVEPLVSRRAVATLEEARQHLRCELPGAYEWITDDDYKTMISEIDSLTESGGTIGPLPDGTVIEVEQVPWSELSVWAGVDPLTASRLGDNAVIDAYNAAHA